MKRDARVKAVFFWGKGLLWLKRPSWFLAVCLTLWLYNLTTLWLPPDCYLTASDCCLTAIWLLSKYHLTAYWLLFDCFWLPSDMYSATYSNGWKLKCCWCSLYHCWATLTMATTVIIYISEKSYFWLGLFWLWGFRFGPKFRRKCADELFCLVLLQVPKLIVQVNLIFGWTKNVIAPIAAQKMNLLCVIIF